MRRPKPTTSETLANNLAHVRRAKPTPKEKANLTKKLNAIHP